MFVSIVSVAMMVGRGVTLELGWGIVPAGMMEDEGVFFFSTCFVTYFFSPLFNGILLAADFSVATMVRGGSGIELACVSVSAVMVEDGGVLEIWCFSCCS